MITRLNFFFLPGDLNLVISCKSILRIYGTGNKIKAENLKRSSTNIAICWRMIRTFNNLKSYYLFDAVTKITLLPWGSQLRLASCFTVKCHFCTFLQSTYHIKKLPSITKISVWWKPSTGSKLLMFLTIKNILTIFSKL